MSETITYSAVMTRVESSAKDLLPDMPKENTQEAWESYQEALEACLDEACDLARQEIDSWDWSIYTYQGFLVYDCLPSDLQTQCEAEYWECNCGINEETPYSLGAAMAFFALVSLLTREIERQCEDLLELCCKLIENL